MFSFSFFNLFFQPDLGGFCITEPKCMLQLGQRCTFVNFCKFFDVLMLIVFFFFVRIGLNTVSRRVICTNIFLFVLVFVFLFTAAIFPLPFVQMGEQSSCLIRLQYLIYDREIMNVLSKWQFCGFLYFCRQYFFFNI